MNAVVPPQAGRKEWIGLAVFAAVMLRHVRASSAPGVQPELESSGAAAGSLSAEDSGP